MVMCCYVVLNVYEKFKELICGICVFCEGMQVFVFMLEILEVVKVELFKLMLWDYIGKVVELVKWI